MNVIWKRLVVGCAVFTTAVSVLGCSVSGTPVAKVVPTGPEGTAIVPYNKNPLDVAELPDPCDIPKSVLTDAGLDPSYPDYAEWSYFRTCSWGIPQVPNDPRGYTAAVYASKSSYAQELKSKTRTNRTPMEFGAKCVGVLADRIGQTPGSDGKAVATWGTSFGSVSILLSESQPGGVAPRGARRMVADFARGVCAHFPS